MKQSEVKKYVQEAYTKLDEALSEIKTARTAVETAEEQVNDAFAALENIPDDEEFEADEKTEESEE